MKYAARFNQYITQAGLTRETLPENIAEMVSAFERCLELVQAAPESESGKWMQVLVQADAVISALLASRYKESIQQSREEKIKQMALKAKALKAKWNKT